MELYIPIKSCFRVFKPFIFRFFIFFFKPRNKIKYLEVFNGDIKIKKYKLRTSGKLFYFYFLHKLLIVIISKTFVIFKSKLFILVLIHSTLLPPVNSIIPPSISILIIYPLWNSDFKRRYNLFSFDNWQAVDNILVLRLPVAGEGYFARSGDRVWNTVDLGVHERFPRSDSCGRTAT